MSMGTSPIVVLAEQGLGKLKGWVGQNLTSDGPPKQYELHIKGPRGLAVTVKSNYGLKKSTKTLFDLMKALQ